MKPAEFEYHRPTTVEEALSILDRLGPAARPLAGGQSLVPLMNTREIRPRAVVDLNAIEELTGIERDGQSLVIGAMVRQSEIERSSTIAELCPMLADATGWIASTAVRNRGTIGGGVAHGDPCGAYPVALLALDAEVVARSLSGTRRVPVRELFTDSAPTVLEPTEILTRVRVPIRDDDRRWAYLEFARRYNARPIVNVATVIGLAADRRCEAVRIAVGGAGPRPRRCPEVEATLHGRQPAPDLLREAARRAATTLRPVSEVHAPAAYRREMAVVHIERALMLALDGRGQSDGAKGE